MSRLLDCCLAQNSHFNVRVARTSVRGSSMRNLMLILGYEANREYGP
jgi:hypothetical protein